MATIYNSVLGTASILTAVGGTITSGDSVYCSYGDDIYTADLNQAAKDLLLFEITEGFGGDIGNGGVSLQVDINQTGTGKFIHGGGGKNVYLAGGSGGVLNHVECRPSKNGKLFISNAATFTLGICVRGFMQVEDTADCAEMRVLGGEAWLKESSANTPTLDVQAGLCRCDRDFDNAAISGAGKLRVNKDTVTPVLIDLYGNAEAALNCGTVTTLKIRPGTHLDLSMLKKPWTVTNLYWPDVGSFRFTPPPSGIGITVTNQFAQTRGATRFW